MLIEEAPDAATEIEAALLHSLREMLPQAENTALTLACRNEAGALIGGLSGSTSYGWLLIKTVWVAPGQRGQGLGSRLLTTAENRAREIGCHSAWLDTSNPEAATFYLKRGYAPFGQLSNTTDQFPPTHRRLFMKKTLL